MGCCLNFLQRIEGNANAENAGLEQLAERAQELLKSLGLPAGEEKEKNGEQE